MAYSPSTLLNPTSDLGGAPQLGAPLLYFFRHGETELNAGNSFRGFKDVDLDENGLEQAKEAAAFTSMVPFGAIFCSDLKRAQQTMKAVRKANSHALELVPEIVAAGRPWNVGKFAGKPKTAANKKEVQMYADSGETIPGGESLGEFRARFGGLFDRAIQTAIQSGKPTALFGHASNGHEIGNILYGDIDRLDVDPGGIVAIFFTRTGLEGQILKGEPTDATDSGYGKS